MKLFESYTTGCPSCGAESFDVDVVDGHRECSLCGATSALTYPSDSATTVPEVKTTMTLEKAIAFAAEKHAGALDKQGVPYICHPLRVMEAVRTSKLGLIDKHHELAMAAVLHDVVEDCDVSLQDIASLFSSHVAQLVDAVTRRKGEDYFREFLPRTVESGPQAVTIKICDITDNLSRPHPSLTGLAHKYAKALRILAGTE